MKIKITMIILFTFILFGCKDEKENSKKSDQHSVQMNNPSNELIENAEVIVFPFVDSTNFNNFKRASKLTNSDVKRLKLDKINVNAHEFYLRYSVPFSNNFKSIAFTYQNGEHELSTTIVNYDNKWNIIDKIEIAYDEIAESLVKKNSSLEKNIIKIDEVYFTEDNKTHNITEYSILRNGKFQINK